MAIQARLSYTGKKVVIAPREKGAFSHILPKVSVRKLTGQDWLELGQKQMKKGNYKKAIRRLMKAAKPEGLGFEAMVCIASCHSELQNRTYAWSWSNDAIDIAPPNPYGKAKLLLALAYHVRAKEYGPEYGHFAIGDYEKAIKLDPSLAEARVGLARLLGPGSEEGMRQMAQAVVAFVRRASAKLKAGDAKGAIRDCDSAEKIRSQAMPGMQFPKIHALKAEAYLGEYDYIGALNSACDALAVDPTSADAKRLLERIRMETSSESWPSFNVNGVGSFYPNP